MRSRLMQYRSDPLMQNHSGVDTIAGAARTVTAFSVETAKGVGDLWTSTRVAGGVAAILALGLVAIAYRARRRGANLMRFGEALERVAAVGSAPAKRAGQLVSLAARSLWRSALGTFSAGRQRMQATYTKARDWLLLPRPYTAKPSAHAQRHLRNALTYFDKWEHAKYWPARRNLCRLAAQQIERAKKHDIKAALSFIDQDGRPDTWTLKQFSAAALFYEARNHMNDRRYRIAIRTLWRALKLAPDRTQYQNTLAEAYIKLGRSNRARRILKDVKCPNLRTTELQAATLNSSLVGIRAYPSLPFPKSWPTSQSET
jgi:tetratricopeptide (TPR) repeat protein